MSRALILRLAIAAAVLLSVLALAISPAAADPAAPPPTIVYCYDRARDVVAQVRAVECQGTIVSEAEAQAVMDRRDRQVREAVRAQPQIGHEGLRLSKLGTAFYVDETGKLVTNDHVIEGCKAVRVRASSGAELAASVLATAPTEDLALLHVDAKPSAVAVFELDGGGTEPFVATVGYPDQGLAPLEPLVTSGLLLKKPANALPTQRLVIKADVRRGNSGGPLFDRQGLVMGMVNAKVNSVEVYRETGRDIEDIGLGIPLPVLLDFLRRNEVRFHQAKGAPVLDAKQILARAREFVARAECWE
jgi:serine protease Do